jgi:hypothetical protein
VPAAALAALARIPGMRIVDDQVDAGGRRGTPIHPRAEGIWSTSSGITREGRVTDIDTWPEVTKAEFEPRW